ncbi:response regulator [Legionella jordanis]|uniref:two-component system response regulator CpxR n=1 Tax=Legionella jordanis TaxID=456 RepID=UPI000F010476|nr:response regulator [Legionella jordanis]RMX18198.1 response regulator [Legionella jordanis]
MNNNILIVDDDTELSDLLVQYLESEGFNVVAVHDGENAVKKALNQVFDAIILDVMLPKLNGFEVLKAIREHLETPVLMLTARGDDIDRIVGLEIGADDYLPKPCNPRELVARLRAILRRTQKIPAQRPIIEHSGIVVDCSKRLATHHGEPMELTNAEFNILEMLIKSPGQAFSKEELTEYALGRKYTAFDRSIDVHISNLRNKLGDNQQGEPW